MLRISNLTLARGAKRLLDGASITVFPGHKVGLVGPNGCGKSSLFALIRGEAIADAGGFDLPPGWVIAHVAQETPAADSSALDFVLDGDKELRQIERALAGAGHDAAGEMLGELHDRLEAIGGYQARSRAAALLSGLGFSEEQQDRPVAEFSGGWRMRLNLAQALMCRSDLLLLDEPTNHLDLDAVMWLEDWLKSYPGTLLLITHDRDFLDAVVTRIAQIDNQKLNEYSGNYSAFERARAAQLALQQSQYARQQKQIAHLHSFVDRFRAKATKAKQAQSRLKTLERMEVIAAAHVESPFSFVFREPDNKPRQLLHLIEAGIGYANRPVLPSVDWTLFYGDRIGLLGPNGAGKSTLLKSLVGELPLLSGQRHCGTGLRIGYFAQHQVDQLRLDESPLQHLTRIDAEARSNTREQELRNFLGGFDFRGDQVTSPVRPFSGGEKARLALALLVWQRPNLLLLDEPTNHLDIEMREALAEALQDFDATLVVVAHDRHLLKATTDQLWLVADGKLGEFDGDLDDYKEWAREYHANRKRPADAALNDVAPDRKVQKRLEAEARQKASVARKPLESRLAKLEKELDALSFERVELENWLLGTDAYAETNKERLQESIRRQGEVATRIVQLEEDWLWVQAELETIKQQSAA
jgi:ATP-binding cassette subfamily F protein 3